MHNRAARGLGQIAACLLIGIVAGAAPAAAQTYPAKPVRIIVPQTPGGASDVLARLAGHRLGERWGQSVVVENRPGAGGAIGTDAVAKAPADGHTLLMSYAGTQAINPSLYATLPYDSVKDFRPVATLAVVPFLLVANPGVAARDLRGFLDLAYRTPGGVTYGSAGNGSVNHLLGEMLKAETGAPLVHVPYRGAAPAITDVLSGQIQSVFASLPSVIQMVRQGSVRALAVTSAARTPALPDLPSVAEQGVAGFDVNPWFGLLAPAGTPDAIVRKINADVDVMLGERAAQDMFREQGAEPYRTTPEAFLALLQADVQRWARVVKASGAKLD
jgi:tripartite-type tricarboxylate transporter receptor subunit TctC